MSTTEEINTLMKLGLTSCQAKVFLTLTKTGKILTAKELSQLSGITRPDIYRILPILHENGLIEKILGNPIKYKAGSLRKTITILFEKRNQETSNLKIKTKELIKKLKIENKKTNFQQEKTNFAIVPPGELILKKIVDSIKKTEKQIDVITSINRLQEATEIFNKYIKKSLRKGVKIRVILEHDDNNKKIENMPLLLLNPNTKIKHSFSNSRTSFIIYDKKRVYFFLEESSRVRESPALWSNSSALLNLAQYNFETKWKKSKTY